jgi:multimeric flavodoxin WrbA
MKIVAILSSPRRDQSSTNLLVNLALEAAKNDGAEIDVVDITQLNIKYCVGCGVCWKKGKCCLPDDLQIVLDKIREADGVLFSSPVYVNNMTAQLKTLLDRMTSPLHCRFLDGKYVSSVVTTGSGDDDTVIAMIDEFAIQCGAAILNGVGAAFIKPGAFDKAKAQSAILGKELVSAIEEHKTFPEQEKIHRKSRQRFARTISFQKDSWQHDYQYWLDKGWLKADE